MASFTGTPGSDTYTGGAGADVFNFGPAGVDVAHGGEGSDSFQALTNGNGYVLGNLTAHGEGGNDQFSMIDNAGGFAVTFYAGTGDDRVALQTGAGAVIDLGDGDDRIDMTAASATVTLGAGHDLVVLRAGSSSLHLTIMDYQSAGASGDQLDLSGYVRHLRPSLESTNLFASGDMRLVQSGADALVQINYFGFQTFITLKNVTAAALTAADLGGYDPLGGPLVGFTRTGGAGADNFHGGAGDDTLIGGGGDDVLFGGGTGVDRLEGGDGTDTLSITGRGGAVLGGNDNDYLEYVHRTNTSIASTTTLLDGGNGDDRLRGTSFNTNTPDGTITLSGGAGDDDLFFFGSTGVVLLGGDGADLLTTAGTGNDTLNGGAGIDTAAYRLPSNSANPGGGVTVSLAITGIQNTGSSGWDQLISIENLTGTDFNDSLTGNGGDNVLSGYAGDDTLNGGAGSDWASYEVFSTAVTIDLSLGAVQANTGGAGVDTLISIENLIGSYGNDTLRGDGGANILRGGSGNDLLDGGAGRDRADYSDAGSIVTVSLSIAGAQQTSSAGFDTLIGIEDLSGSSFTDVLTGDGGTNFLSGQNGDDFLYGLGGDDILNGGAGQDTLDGGAGADTATYLDETTGVRVTLSTAHTTSVGTSVTDAFVSIENLEGSAFADALRGDAGANILTGGGGDDELYGEAGNDTLLGGDGDDAMFAGIGDDYLDGGVGADKVSYSDLSSGLGVNINLSLAGAQNTIGAGADTLVSIGSVTGSQYADVLTGNGGDNVILGLAGDDTLMGGEGADTLDGGEGSDTASYAGSGGVNATLAIRLVGGPGVEVTDTFLSIENLVGTDFGDTLRGSSVANVLTGGGGADLLWAAEGDDILLGGDDHDTLHGGLGDDVLIGGAGFDIVSYSDLNLLAGPRPGVTVNLLLTGAQDTVGGGVDTLSGIENVHGTRYNDVLIGDNGGNLLMGFGGDDIIEGGAGADTIDGGGGLDVFDTASYAGATAGVTVSLALTSQQDTGAAGMDSLINIEWLTGSGFNDTLFGNSGENRLVGGFGNDALDGGLGADRLYGGTGDDTFLVDVQGDMVFEFAGEGTDTVVTTGDYYLYGNIEILTLEMSAGNIFGVGNSLANTLTGNGGANLLLGGGGNDTINGGAGADSLFGEDGVDALFGEAGADHLVGGAGNDTLDGGEGADSLYGQDGDDLLTGGGGVDVLIAGAGNDALNGGSGLFEQDLMDGGAGDDEYLVDAANDLTFEAAGGGTDTVTASMAAGGAYYLYANVENLMLIGQTTSGVGNELANVITGNELGNWLLGGAGNDTLNGKNGADVLFGQDGADTFVFQRGTGGDVIGDFAVGVDKIKLTGLYSSFAEVQANMVQNNGMTGILFGQGDLVVIHNVAMSSFTAADFIF